MPDHLTPEALDALIEKLKSRADEIPQEVADRENSCSACCGSYGRETWDDYADHEDRLLMLECTTSIDALTAERDALRSQLAAAQKEIGRCHARLEITHEWRADETGEWVKVPVADPLKYPDAVYCRDETIKLLEDEVASLKEKNAKLELQILIAEPPHENDFVLDYTDNENSLERKALYFAREISMRCLFNEHDSDEQEVLLNYESLKFERDCDIVAARSLFSNTLIDNLSDEDLIDDPGVGIETKGEG
jgi:uncharacterized coiled-coil protein SlyX